MAEDNNGPEFDEDDYFFEPGYEPEPRKVVIDPSTPEELGHGPMSVAAADYLSSYWDGVNRDAWVNRLIEQEAERRRAKEEGVVVYAPTLGGDYTPSPHAEYQTSVDPLPPIGPLAEGYYEDVVFTHVQRSIEETPYYPSEQATAEYVPPELAAMKQRALIRMSGIDPAILEGKSASFWAGSRQSAPGIYFAPTPSMRQHPPSEIVPHELTHAIDVGTPYSAVPPPSPRYNPRVGREQLNMFSPPSPQGRGERPRSRGVSFGGSAPRPGISAEAWNSELVDRAFPETNPRNYRARSDMPRQGRAGWSPGADHSWSSQEVFASAIDVRTRLGRFFTAADMKAIRSYPLEGASRSGDAQDSAALTDPGVLDSDEFRVLSRSERQAQERAMRDMHGRTPESFALPGVGGKPVKIGKSTIIDLVEALRRNAGRVSDQEMADILNQFTAQADLPAPDTPDTRGRA